MRKMMWNKLKTMLASQKPGPTSASRSMTLIEIMVVLAIITLIGGVVSVAVFNQFKKAQIDTATTQMKQISDALELYKLSNRKYPSTADGLNALTAATNGGPVMNSVPKDPWGQDYVYIFPGQGGGQQFDIISYGPDGSAGGGDDISNAPANGTPQN